MDIDSARKLLPSKTLQGNLDPAVLYGSDEQIIKSTLNMVEKFGKSQYIANLGHGVYPDMNPKKLKLFIETIQNA
jgi:uroporphyrinogen decarboxylase